jgi:nucleotide-binding universal stress UspA family protein
MGRDRNLPPFFGKIDPRRRTPAVAILISGGLVILMVTASPIKDLASAADILGITFQALLALPLFRLSPIAWFTVALWIGAGLVFYLTYARTSEAIEEPELVLHEEIVTVRRHSLIFPLDRKTRVERLMPLVSAWAQENEAEVFALHVVRVPAQLSIRQGRMFLAEGKALLERVIAAAKEADVPVHSMIRLGRDEVKDIFRTARQRRASLMVLDWRGYTRSRGRRFGHVIDRLVDNPHCDVAVVSHKGMDGLKRILGPASGGPDAALAASLAAQLGVHFDASVTMLNIGNITERLAAQCPKTVIMVKRRDPLEAILRRIRPGVPSEPPVEATDGAPA